MKQLKAFIRKSKTDEVVQALIKAGAPGITVSHVRGLGYGYDPIEYTLAPGVLGKAQEVAKIEVICVEQDVDGLLQAISQVAHTGLRGDGIVFVTAVDRVVRVRTGEEGRGGLKQ